MSSRIWVTLSLLNYLTGQFSLLACDSLEQPRKRVLRRDYLDHVVLWACLWGNYADSESVGVARPAHRGWYRFLRRKGPGFPTMMDWRPGTVSQNEPFLP